MVIKTVISEDGVLIFENETRPEHIQENLWKFWNIIGFSVIVENLSDDYLHIATDNERATVYEIMKKLDNIFSRKSMGTQMAVNKEIYSLKYAEGDTIADHIRKLSNLSKEYEKANDAPLPDSIKISQLLNSLPSSFETKVCVLKSLPNQNLSFDDIESQLLEHELELKNKGVDIGTKVLTAVDTNSQNKNNSNQQLKHNNKPNNFKPNNNFKSYNNFKPNNNFKRNKKVYNRNNYQRNNNSFDNNNKNNNNRENRFHYNKNNRKCEFCGRNNHVKDDCIFYKRWNAKSTAEINTAVTNQNDNFAFMMKVNANCNEDVDVNFIEFVLDSGATDHMANHLDIFSSITNLEQPLTVSTAIKDKNLEVTKKGQIDVITNAGYKGSLQDVLFVPQCPNNLLSVRQLQRKGMSVIFKSNGEVTIEKDGLILMYGETKNKLTYIKFKINILACYKSNIDTDKFKLWHERLGHIGNSKLLQIQKNNLVEQAEILKSINVSDQLCEACIIGKQARLHFNKEKDTSYVKRPLFIIHSDVCGPMKTTSIDDKHYFVTFIDQFTHYTVVYLLKQKSQVLSCFHDFVNKAEAMFNLKIVYLYCDNGTEYLSNEFKEFCSQKGIQYHLTVPYTPQQNSVAERMNRTIVEKARAMVHGAKLPKQFWGEAILTAAYLINVSPTKAISLNKTPYELWHNRKPNIERMRIFGCTAYALIKTQKDKFDSKSIKGIFVGYANNGYKIYIPESNKFILSRDIVFDEENYLQSRPLLDEAEMANEAKKNSENLGNNNDEAEMAKAKKNSDSEHNNDEVEINNNSNSQNKTEENNNSGISIYRDEVEIHNNSNSLNETEKNNNSVHPKTNKYDLISRRALKDIDIHDITRNSRKRQNDQAEQNSPTDQNTLPLKRSARLQNKPAISYYEDENYCYNTIAQGLVNDVPNKYSEILDRTDKLNWLKAVDEELKSLYKNDTWTLVPRPLDTNIVECRWVFATKRDPVNNTHKYKARLVAKGFSQQYMLDYSDTFAPVARISTFRIMMSVANQYELLIHQMDVKTAFLNGKLEEEIYMHIPEGVKANNNYVCKLNKALYGLKQAARCWFQKFDQVLQQYGFTSSEVDKCLYILDKKDISKNTYLLLYVDDILIFTKNKKDMKEIKQYLKSQFEMVDMEEIKTFLGITVKRSNDILTLDQSEYLEKVLTKFNMDTCNSISTPLPTKLNYEALNSEIHYDAPCRELLGCLMWTMLTTRPDLCFALNVLSQFQNKNNFELWKSLKRILRYIKGTINFKLIYRKTNFKEKLVSFVDADWGSNEVDRKSTTGFIFRLFDKSTISWNSKRQNSVATSSTEAEYMALFEAVKEACWLRNLLNSIKIEIVEPIKIYEDNNGCISIANNPTDHKRSKHIDIKYHFSREKVNAKLITIESISSRDQLADAFTKSLAETRFILIRKEIGLDDMEGDT